MEKKDEEKRAEAERWLATAVRLLTARDLEGVKRFALKASEADPLWDGVDQVMVIADVLISAEKRINNHPNWYAILQLETPSNDLELIKRHYKRFAFVLHPDRNRHPFAETAFKFVSDSWSVLSDPEKKTLYDNELNLFCKFSSVSLGGEESGREKRRKTEGQNGHIGDDNDNEMPNVKLFSFWTVCPYCYHLYEYPKVYLDCVLRCQICSRGFHAVDIPSPPPVAPGGQGYYCCWSYFPIAYSMNGDGTDGTGGTGRSPFARMFTRNSDSNVDKAGVGVDSNVDKAEEGGDDLDGSWEVGKEGKSGTAGKRERRGNGNENGNVDGGVAVGVSNVAKRGMRKKTTARRPKRQSGRVVGVRENVDRVGMDLNVELRADVEEVAVVDVDEVEETEGIEIEATDGSGFFEGLDDILGELAEA